MDPEDQKLSVLARAVRARARAEEGAALRDLDGRTYAGAGVALPSLSLSAVGVCVAMALSSGSRGAEAVVVLADDPVSEADLAVVRDFAGPGVAVHRGSADGRIEETLTT
ncbi:MAG: cytidine deaminase [Actinomycetota bacterium]|nr:cytidine deaminase [Actinomycetota bacterium]